MFPAASKADTIEFMLSSATCAANATWTSVAPIDRPVRARFGMPPQLPKQDGGASAAENGTLLQCNEGNEKYKRRTAASDLIRLIGRPT